MKNRSTIIAGAMLMMASSVIAFAKDDAVARMGKNELSVAEFSRLVAQANPGQSGKPDEQTLEQAARLEIIRRTVIEQAKNQGWDQKPEIRERMARAADQTLLTAYMNDIARPPANYPSDKELRNAYEAAKDQLKTPKQYRLAQIYVSSQGGKADKEAGQKINDIWRDANKRGNDFGNLAKRYSEHKSSAEQGGDMGWLPETGMLPEIRSAVSSLNKSDISKPVRSAQGYHILKVLDVKEPAIRSFEEVKPILIEELRMRRAKEIEASYLQSLMDKNPIAISKEGLKEVLSSNTH